MKNVIRTLMAVVVVMFCTGTFLYYVKDTTARAEANIPSLPDFEHTNNQQFLIKHCCTVFVLYILASILILL